MTALGVLCCFALFVCLTLLASFFLPSHLSFKNMYIDRDRAGLAMHTVLHCTMFMNVGASKSNCFCVWEKVFLKCIKMDSETTTVCVLHGLSFVKTTCVLYGLSFVKTTCIPEG